MPFSITCKCGARLEIDDKFAGQSIKCPDCQQPVQVDANEPVNRRTSGLALASIILALVGAFTVVGTITAVFLGAIALLHISNRSNRLSGKGYAIAGILIGLVMTGATVVALSSVELFGLAAIVSSAPWAGNLEYGGPLEVICNEEGYAIKRPSTQWGVYKPPHWRGGGDLNHSAWDDLLLVLPSDEAIVLCYATRVPPNDTIDECRAKFENDFRHMDKVGLFNKVDKHGFRFTPMTVKDTKRPPANDALEMIEMQIDKSAGGEDKTFVVQLRRNRGDDLMYVVIGGVRRSRFSKVQGQLHEVMDSFRLLPRRNW